MRISDWSSDVCSSDLDRGGVADHLGTLRRLLPPESYAGAVRLRGHAFAHHPALSGTDQPGVAAGRDIEFARQILGECGRADPAQRGDDRGAVAVPWRRRI